MLLITNFYGLLLNYCLYAYLMRQLSLQTFIVCMTVTIKLTFGRVIAITNRNITTKATMIDSNKEEKKNLQIGLTIESISDFNLKQSNFKASVSLLMVVEKSGRPPGSIIVKYDQYLYPFSDLQFTGNKARPKDAYRLLISASDGTTSTRSNYELEIHCPFNLKHYPFDSHYCPIDIYAGKHPSRQLSLSWYYSDGARLNASIGPISMQTSLVSSENCNFEGIYAVTELNTASARFSCLRVQLHFHRPFQTSFFRYFLPTIILVALTWIIFYIERQRLQSRITIVAISSLLTFFCAMLWNNEVPSTAYLTAADVWVFLCNIFILLSLLEVIAVHILMKMSHKQLLLANRNESVRAESQYRREKQAAKRGRSISPRPLIANGRMFEMKPLDQDFLGSTSTSNYDTLINDYFHRWSDYYSVTAARVDLSARIILPLAYGIVASLYFSFYLLL